MADVLRMTDRPVADICFAVGLQSVGSFTTSFTGIFGKAPVAYRESFPPAAAHARVPLCYVQFFGRPQRSTNGEDATNAPS